MVVKMTKLMFFLDVADDLSFVLISLTPRNMKWTVFPDKKFLSVIFPLWTECTTSQYSWAVTALLIGWHYLFFTPPLLPSLSSFPSLPLSHLHAHKKGGVSFSLGRCDSRHVTGCSTWVGLLIQLNVPLFDVIIGLYAPVPTLFIYSSSLVFRNFPVTSNAPYIYIHLYIDIYPSGSCCVHVM